MEYVARLHDRQAGDYEVVRRDRHPDGLPAVIERALKVSTRRGQSVSGYAEGVWRRWWYEDEPATQPAIN